MNVEETRQASFSTWPDDAVTRAPPVDRLAAAGFYYVGPDLATKCYSCGLLIAEWSPTDIVSARHAQLSPHCVLLRNPQQANNVPLLNPPVPPVGANVGCWVSETSVFKSEQARLDSFADWPIPFIVRPEALAATGFYFLRQGDKVACAFCTGIINRWERGDVPKEEHRRHFPACPFLLGLPVGNISRDTSAESLCQSGRLAELGIQPHRGPRHPKYSTVESRLVTFEKWPSAATQTPSDLAQAGFFHETDISHDSVEDQVRCFHCDGGLRNWEPGDTPWREHARWFPTCPFLLLVKGQPYVDSVQDEYRTAPFDVATTSTSGGGASSSTTTAHTSSSRADALSASTEKTHLLATGMSGSVGSVGRGAGEGCSAGGDGNAEGSLEEENRRLRDARQCKICMDAEIGTVLLPCGHLVACVGCAPSLLDCPLCRQTIKATVRTFLS